MGSEWQQEPGSAPLGGPEGEARYEQRQRRPVLGLFQARGGGLEMRALFSVKFETCEMGRFCLPDFPLSFSAWDSLKGAKEQDRDLTA